MKIVTVNVSEKVIEQIKGLIGENGLYPSRSELVRAAVHQFLADEIEKAKRLVECNGVPEPEPFDETKFVRVPVVSKKDIKEPVREFKVYKIIKRLEY